MVIRNINSLRDLRCDYRVIKTSFWLWLIPSVIVVVIWVLAFSLGVEASMTGRVLFFVISVLIFLGGCVAFFLAVRERKKMLDLAIFYKDKIAYCVESLNDGELKVVERCIDYLRRFNVPIMLARCLRVKDAEKAFNDVVWVKYKFVGQVSEQFYGREYRARELQKGRLIQVEVSEAGVDPVGTLIHLTCHGLAHRILEIARPGWTIDQHHRLISESGIDSGAMFDGGRKKV